MALIDSIESLADRYDLFLIDLWGVVYDGTQIYPEVNSCLNKLLLQNKKIVFLSNSPKLNLTVKENLAAAGLNLNSQYFILSSGEFASKQLNKTAALQQQQVYFIGPSSHQDFKDHLNLNYTQTIANCDMMIVSGFEANYVLDDYALSLDLARERKLTMHCINPDKFAIVGEHKIPCAGLIADKYQQLGGDVIFYGKPYLPIYESLYHNFNIPKERIVAIGDSLMADIQGAENFNIDSLLILSGIHAQEIDFEPRTSVYSAAKLQQLFSLYRTKPTYMMTKLQ